MLTIVPDDKNERGEPLFDFIMVNVLDMLNIGCVPNFVRAEVIDVTICTQNTTNLVHDWRVMVGFSISDHKWLSL